MVMLVDIPVWKNKERQFIPLLLNDAHIKGSLAEQP